MLAVCMLVLDVQWILSAEVGEILFSTQPDNHKICRYKISSNIETFETDFSLL